MPKLDLTPVLDLDPIDEAPPSHGASGSWDQAVDSSGQWTDKATIPERLSAAFEGAKSDYAKQPVSDILAAPSVAAGFYGDKLATSPEEVRALARGDTGQQSENLGITPPSESPFMGVPRGTPSLAPVQTLEKTPEPKIPEGLAFQTALGNELLGSVKELAAPENIAILAATGGAGALGEVGAIAQRLVSGGFAIQSLGGLKDSIAALRSATTPEDKAKAWSGIITSAAIAAPTTMHSVGGLSGLRTVTPEVPAHIRTLIDENATILPKAAAAAEKAVTEPSTQEVISALPVEKSDASLLREERSQVGLQKVEQGNAEAQAPGNEAPAPEKAPGEVALKETGTAAVDRILALPDADAAKLNQRAQSFEGVEFTPADLPAIEKALELQREKLNSAAEKAMATNAPEDQVHFSAEQGRTAWLETAKQGASGKFTKTDNWAGVLEERAAAEKTKGEATNATQKEVAQGQGQVPIEKSPIANARLAADRPIQEPYSDKHSVSLQVAATEWPKGSEQAVRGSLPKELADKLDSLRFFSGEGVPTNKALSIPARVQLTFKNKADAQAAVDYFKGTEPGGAQVPPAPVKVAAKMQAEVSTAAKTEGKRSAADIKDELVNEIQAKLSKAPSEAKPGDKVTIDIPGDGTFTVPNTVEALSGMLARAKKIKTDAGKPPGVPRAAIKASGRAIAKFAGDKTKAESPAPNDISGAQGPISVGPGAETRGELPDDRPTFGETIPARAGGGPGAPPVAAPTPTSAQGVFAGVRGLFSQENVGKFKEQIGNTLGTISGQTLPRITRLGKEAGEAGARYISSKIFAPFGGRLFARDVLTGLDIDPMKFGSALSEDNLRSIEGSTFSFVGEGKPFKTEAEYQSFLKEPNVQEAIKRHIDNWNNMIEPMYREAMQIDPTEELPSRGVQTGARVNLAAIREGEPMPPGAVSSAARGGLLNTLRRKSPFGVKAKGTGESYAGNYEDIIANTFNRQLEIANKNAFDNALVEKGLAEIGDPGQRPVIGGEETVGFPLKRKTIVTPQGAFSQNKTLYIRKSLAREYRNAANVDDNPFRDSSVLGPVRQVNDVLNQAALAGLTDATVHVTNLSTALMQLPDAQLGLLSDSLLSAAGRADIPLKVGRVLVKGAPEAIRNSKLLKAVTPDFILKGIEDAFWKNQTQLADLAEIGALKEQHPSTGLPGLRQMSRVIQWYDRSVRAVLDDSYQNLAEQGLVENSETARREFVNQVGQYNKRAQGALVRLSRDLGTGPFVTAGRAFNVLGTRAATLNPGVKASTMVNVGLLRANMASKWVGLAALTGLFNYLITGKSGGRPGTPLGSIDTGKNDDQGRIKSFSVANLTGQGRAMRVTGIRGATEATLKGLPAQVAADAAARDIINSWTAPFSGPPVKAGVIAASGFPSAVNVGRVSKVVPPGQSQTLENVKAAALEANPVVAGIHRSQEPGKTMEELVRTQLPRFTMQVKQPEQMIANYPAIVRRAQANAFMEDVIHRARYIEKDEDRVIYVRDALSKLDQQDREHAVLTLRFRKIKF